MIDSSALLVIGCMMAPEIHYFCTVRRSGDPSLFIVVVCSIVRKTAHKLVFPLTVMRFLGGLLMLNKTRLVPSLCFQSSC